MKRLVNPVLLARLFALGTFGCGQSDCEKLGETLCDKACAYAEGSEHQSARRRYGSV